MSKKDEALKLALEALQYIYEGANNQGPHTGISWRCVSKKAEPAITAIREALAEQPASKPWVGLTNQELIDLTAIYSGAPLYCAIEAKLKEKNC